MLISELPHRDGPFRTACRTRSAAFAQDFVDFGYAIFVLGYGFVGADADAEPAADAEVFVDV